MNNGAYLTHLLSLYDVDCVFGIPGVHTLELYRALNGSDIRHITPRHEQGAGFMADGYARVTGKPGVCFIISGPGMTNILTAMGQAWSESIPMLVISTVNSHGRMGSGEGWLHELPNQQALVSGVSAFSHTVHEACEIPQVLARAFAIFDSCRPRPVHIEIPINILNELSPFSELPQTVLRLAPPSGDSNSITNAAKLLNSAATPVILTGGGATSSATLVQKLADTLDSPVVMTVNARGVLPSDHPLAVSASASLPEVRALIEGADVVLAIGTELGPTDYDFNEDGQFVISGTFIQIDIDAQQIMRTRIPDMGIVGDAGQTIALLLALIERQGSGNSGNSGTERAAVCLSAVTGMTSTRNSKYIELLDIINQQFDDPIIVGDSTQIIYATNSNYGCARTNSYFNSAMGLGTLGYALPAAIGAAIGRPEKTVVAISGDGGLQFCLAELATAVDANIQIILIVHENGGYVEIKKSMSAVDIDPIGVDLMLPDITAVVAAFGWNTLRANSFDELPSVFDKCQTLKNSALVLMNDAAFE
ncbi:MAG: acetolactate synthase-1/2/3 large subunit [Granulosicoccus sp.]|jgi:acetolactate synthase-1/2/3 large subunit